jgi:hypothetical protein
MRNAEPIIARYARDMVTRFKSTCSQQDLKKEVKKFESCLSAAWDIFREHGLLMMVLWLHDKEKDQERKSLLQGTIDLLNEEAFGLKGNKNFSHEDFTGLTDRLMKLTESLERTLLARKLIERMFAYAKRF